ncbi:hypothetical protein P2318_29585 [Myxococcaceae bacterium GXIMD 01537]
MHPRTPRSATSPLRLLTATLLLAAGCDAPERGLTEEAGFPDDMGESFQALCESNATGYVARTPYCGSIPDAYTKASVNVGWYPYRANKATAIYRAEGSVLGTLAAGQTFSLQSTRNPDCLDSPPLRPPRSYNGEDYVWGYAADGSLTGWVKAADLTYDGEGSCARLCQDGPAGADFQVKLNGEGACSELCCDEVDERYPVGNPDRSRNLGGCWSAQVNSQYDGDGDCGGSTMNVTRWVSVEDSHLRFAPLSTSIRYLFKCDKVQLLYSANGWGFVELTASTHPGFSPVGSRGWLMASSLSASKPTGCP